MAFSGNAATSLVAGNVMLILNNKVVGVCTSASWDIDYNVRPIYGIDQTIPQELAPTTYKTSFNFNGIRVVKQSLEDAGIISYPGISAFAPYISIAVIERLSGTALVNIQAAMIDSVKNSVSAKGMMTFDISGTGFVALSNSNNGIAGYTGIPQMIT